MRIISGQGRGQKIKVPKSEGTRPAQDLVRQAIFSILYGMVEGSRVLDLFAGSGSLGLEALSRGAEQSTFVDDDRHCAQIIKENLRLAGFESRGEVSQEDAQRFVDSAAESGERFNLIFLDPPYKIGTPLHLLKSLAQILAPSGVVIFTHAKETAVPENIDGLSLLQKRAYGGTTVSILAQGVSPLPDNHVDKA